MKFGTCCEFDADLYSFEKMHYLQNFKGCIMYKPSQLFAYDLSIHIQLQFTCRWCESNRREGIEQKWLNGFFLKTKKIHQIIMNSNYTSRYELTDPKAQNIVRLITESVQVENIRFLFAMPWIRHFLPEITGWNTQKKVLR